MGHVPNQKAIERGKGEEQDATQFAQRESMMKYSCHSSTAKVRKKMGSHSHFDPRKIDLHLALGDKFSKNMQLPAVTKELSTKIGRNIRPSANK